MKKKFKIHSDNDGIYIKGYSNWMVSQINKFNPDDWIEIDISKTGRNLSRDRKFKAKDENWKRKSKGKVYK